MNKPNPQMVVHKADDRGKADHGWLQARHSFSFAQYQDPEKMGFGSLIVINDDIIAAAKGFATHPHQNMEIITIPIKGSLAHKDSEGNSGEITSGEIQVMSAGSGIRHSEFNASSTDPVNLLQIWVLPQSQNTSPRYQQTSFDWEAPGSTLIASPEGAEGLDLNQQAYFNIANYEQGEKFTYALNNKDHGVYFFVIDGQAKIDGEALGRRDAAAIAGRNEIEIEATTKLKALVIEVVLK